MTKCMAQTRASGAHQKRPFEHPIAQIAIPRHKQIRMVG
jgi:hypothetical protein